MKHDFIRENPLLIQALRQAQDEKTDALVEASKSSTHVASDHFKGEMERLLQAQRKPYYKYTNTQAKRAMLAFAAVLILMITMVFSVSALREPVVKFFVEVYELFSSVLFEKSLPDETNPTTLEQIYLPEHVPNGYILDETSSFEMSTMAFFQYADGNGTIEFKQFLNESAGFTINTEGIVHEDILVGEYEGIYYSNLGSQTILWANDHYSFSVSGPVPKEELLAMALSLKEK